MTTEAASTAPVPEGAPVRRKYVRAVGPRLKGLLALVFGLFAVLAANSLYLASVTCLEWVTKRTYQDFFYQVMFLVHLVLGLAFVLPVIVFGIVHMRNAHDRPNRRAVRVGYALFAAAIVLIASGLVLTRIENVLEVKHATVRRTAYWLHVAMPVACVWLFVLHRLAGPRIKWKVGGAWLAVAGGFAIVMLVLHAQDPRQWNVAGPKSGALYFFPSLAKTATGNFIPAHALDNDRYCLQCHADVHEQWSHSAHRLSSFNNPAYLFSVLETRKAMHARDGNVRGSRFCAGCHDLVPFFSGAFDDPKFDDPSYDLASDSMAQAGITCSGCHAITSIDSTRGNADYTIEEPLQYPFAFSENRVLQWVNRQLVKSKPEFHKKTFLKPLHKTAEFCGACHKVHLPEELNGYKWLRGQNHYDPFLLSGVSGHGVQSFYYPPKAKENCNVCHMNLVPSQDFGAKDFDGSGVTKVHDHMFPSANTAVPYLLGHPASVTEAHARFNEGVMRVDIFGLKEGGTIDGELTAPLRPRVPALAPGGTYLLETVIRTVKMGHLFTQGTADSNEVWVDVKVTSGGRVLGRSGGRNPADGEVDPWSHFVNAYVIDREGKRIDRRNAQDIFVALYNHQIPPGAADVVHYQLDVPSDAREPVTVEVNLRYRKFDARYMRYFQGAAFDGNDLPVLTLASDSITFPIASDGLTTPNADSTIVEWERWNDYGIGLLRKGETGSSKGELRQAEAAFARVEDLGRPDGPLNRARVYVKEGRLDEAVSALQRAARFDPPAPPWSVAWFSGLVNKQNGFLDEAIADFRGLATMDTAETRQRGFDFSKDYVLLGELGQTLVERSLQERGEARRSERDRILREARSWFDEVLAIDAENVVAHYNLARIASWLGDEQKALEHQALHAKYKLDDNAFDRAVVAARKDSAAADHAAEAVVIYDLRRPGAYELSER